MAETVATVPVDWVGFVEMALCCSALAECCDEQRHEVVAVWVRCPVTTRRLMFGDDDESVKTAAVRIGEAVDVTVYGVACTR